MDLLRIGRVVVLIPALLWILTHPAVPAAKQQGTVASQLGAPDVSEILRDLELNRLDPPMTILYTGEAPALREYARRWQVAMLEASAFWQNMLGAVSDGGLLLVDSPVWTALRPDRSHGMPATRVMTENEGFLTLLPVESSTAFSEFAGETATIAPLEYRGPLLAHGLASPEGAAEYTRAYAWVLLGEELAAGLRIGTESWWQRRLVGSAAAWMFLESPRGRELAPGALEVLETWGRFWRDYLKSVSLGLQVVASSPPAGDPRTIVEMDARLLGIGEAFWRISGSSLFDKMRRAWPFDSHFESIEETLESLWKQVPELESWENILLNPRGDPPIDHN